MSARRRLLDEDNLVGGAKALRDAIAQLLGIDDSELGVRWHYSQAEVRTEAEEGTLVRVEVPIGSPQGIHSGVFCHRAEKLATD
jgi:hypothetical protein